MRLWRGNESLIGERIELLPHRREDFALYEQWYADPEIWRLTSWRPQPTDPPETRRLFEEREQSDKDESYAIHVKGHRRPIGVIGLMNIGGIGPSADMFVILGDPESRQLGYGTEAIELIAEHGFEKLGLDSIGLSVFAFNEEALSTYEKIGFKKEGRMERAVQRDGGLQDAILMRLTRRDWETLRSG